MQFSIIVLTLASLIIASPQGTPEVQAAPETHLEISTHECSAAYQDPEGLVWSIQKEHKEDLHQSKINIFSPKTGRPTRIEKHIKHGGSLVIKPHCHRDSFELINRLDKKVNICKGEAHHGGNGHNKCHCEHLAPGDSFHHNGDDSIRINDHNEDECTGKGLFQLNQ